MLPAPLAPMALHPQFLLAKTIWDPTKGKYNKLPVNPNTGKVCDAHDREAWVDAATALHLKGDLELAFVFTRQDPFFFLDIDNCYENGTWSPLALELIGQFAGAAVETSFSGKGLHIFGTGNWPDKHRCKNIPLDLEFYTEGRFVVLTCNVAEGGSADKFCDIPTFLSTYLPAASEGVAKEWGDEPRPEWDGPEDDDELLEIALRSRSAKSAFGTGASFSDLFYAAPAVLGAVYPDASRPYDASSADMALAQHLAFYTGCNPERMERLMLRSQLVREKWDREDYMHRTILGACSRQTSVYGQKSEGPKLEGSDAQVAWAEKIRAKHEGAGIERTDAKFWIDNRDKSTEQLKELASTGELPHVGGAVLVTGVQYLTAEAQIEKFQGCVYIQEIHRIITPEGRLLRTEQFNATHGGYDFQLNDSGKSTRKAWEAFTESQVVRFPKVSRMIFKPQMQAGALIGDAVNAYVPEDVPMKEGDVSPFLGHLAKVLPSERDQKILLTYMQACVQYKGTKFQWTPLLQGVEGNGKTLFTRCVANAVGRRYTHFPKANDIDNKFNGWLLNKIFIGVEDIYVPDHRREVVETLKPMITGDDGLEIQLKGADQVTAEICANFMLNSNHRDAIKKTLNDRRFCVFYTAQQSMSDLHRDGMGGDYFPKMYRWLKEEGGYAIVSHFLNHSPIDPEFDPSKGQHRAPETSSMREVLAVSMGVVEQEVLEAIEEGRIGFRGDWISSVSLDTLLSSIRKPLSHYKRREMMQGLGYDYHPALKEGRATKVILIDGNKKPRLYAKVNSHAWHSQDPILDYIKAQEA